MVRGPAKMSSINRWGILIKRVRQKYTDINEIFHVLNTWRMYCITNILVEQNKFLTLYFTRTL